VSVAASIQSESVGYVTLVRHNRKFRLLWAGQIVSLLGDWFDLIASASLIAILTQSGTAVGGLFVVRMLAPFAVSPLAGVAADRYNRKRLLIVTDLSRGLTVLGFLLVRHPGDVWLVYVLTALQMGMSGFFFPTRNAILPDITTPAELGAANALSASTWSVMLAFGAALGGLASGTFGVYPSFVLDAFSFFASALLIRQIVYTPPSTSHLDDRTVRAALRQYGDGLRYLRDHRDIFFIALNKSANSLFVAGAFQVFQVTISERVFVIGESGGISLGLMYAAVGIGTGVGPIVIRRYIGDRDRSMRLVLIASYLVSAAGLALVSTLTSFPVVLLGSMLRGVGAGIIWVFSTQLLLQLTPNRVRGRVFSTEFAMFTLMSAIASGAAGGLLDAGFDVGTLVAWQAALPLIPALLWGLWVFFGEPQAPVGDRSLVGDPAESSIREG
jgi:MFS family permease